MHYRLKIPKPTWKYALHIVHQMYHGRHRMKHIEAAKAAGLDPTAYMPHRISEHLNVSVSMGATLFEHAVPDHMRNAT